jgi:7,8-dihydropterin-6-yl-methyl-4-(beta-D-ribofuranosyl)aminobenzene 5'-phosphate synthase
MKRYFVFLIFIFMGTIILFGGSAKNVSITILYDNYLHTEGAKTDWGFSCLIRGTEKTILFDTGTKPDILFYNIKKLKVDTGDIQLVVITHNHLDHTGGLISFLETHPKPISVYIPHSFANDFVDRVKKHNAQVIPVDEPIKICNDVYSTGEMGVRIKEQSLILDTKKGLVVINGCSHPGIVSIVKRAKEIHKKNVFLVFGGFHLMSKSEEELNNIIAQFKELGVVKVGATHCTGDKAINQFREAYKNNFVEMGVGKVIKIEM